MSLQIEAYIGEIRMWGGPWAPTGWHFCDGTHLAVSQYQALFSLLGTYYGGDGVNDFALPDLRGRTPVNAGQGPGLTDYYQVGLKVGHESARLVAANLPQVQIGIPAYDGDATIDTPDPQLCLGKSRSATAPAHTVEVYSDQTPNTTIRGGNIPGNSTSFNIVQPLLSVCFIIAVDGGIYPSRQ